jgi:voltage-gated potassium channel
MSARKKPLPRPHYNEGDPLTPWREMLNTVIFGAETPAGKTFDIVLIISIVCSVAAVMLGSVPELYARYSKMFLYAEWFFTVLFTIEYALRLVAVRKPWLYCRSFFGIVDFLSIVPTYLSFLLPGIKYMLIVRVLRLLRIFRVLKLSEYMGEAQVLMKALSKSRHKIFVFLYAVCTLVIIFGSLMYVVESDDAGFTSIPRSVYWAIVTLTTVGYGDIAPQTPLGQLIASAIMIMGYGIIAVPTGIYSAELMKATKQGAIDNRPCPDCGETGHDFDADFCKFCGHELDD